MGVGQWMHVQAAPVDNELLGGSWGWGTCKVAMWPGDSHPHSHWVYDTVGKERSRMRQNADGPARRLRFRTLILNDFSID